MINDYFNPCIYDDSLPFDQESYSNAYYALRQRLKGYIDTALKSLERKPWDKLFKRKIARYRLWASKIINRRRKELV